MGRGGDRCLGGEWGVVTTHTEIMVPLGLACNTVKGFLSKASASRADSAGVRGGWGCGVGVGVGGGAGADASNRFVIKRVGLSYLSLVCLFSPGFTLLKCLNNQLLAFFFLLFSSSFFFRIYSA